MDVLNEKTSEIVCFKSLLDVIYVNWSSDQHDYDSCWLWVLAISIFCFTGSSGAMNFPWVSRFFVIVVNINVSNCGLSLGDVSSKCGPVWSSGSSLSWDLPDTEFEITNWKFKGLGVIELSVGGHWAFSGNTSLSESVMNHVIWDTNFKAETIFHPVDWSEVGIGEVLEVWVRWAHLKFIWLFLKLIIN